MVLNSYAKINLSLSVNSKLKKKNLHEIQSYYCLIDLCDKINIRKIKKKNDKIIFQGPFAKHIKKSNNSIANLLAVLRKLKFISNYYSVKVYKNIPVFSGLGGGTSNAAFILRFLLKSKAIKIIDKVEKLIGSDLRLFFYKQGFIENLKTIKVIKKKQKLFFLLLRPNINCSTRKIYSMVTKYSKKNKFSLKKINTKKKFINTILTQKNELQWLVEKKYPIFKKLLADMSAENGCYFSRMTGSGSVCYGLFDNESSSKKALRKIKTKYPNFWLSIAKTV